MIPMTVISDEAFTEAGDEDTLQDVAYDGGSDMEPISDTRYRVFIKLRPLYL